MSNTILIKRSGTANAIPSSGNLSLGELAINYTDGNLFYKDAGGTVKVIASNQTFTLTGNISAGNISTGGLITATGNINGGNINTANIVSAGGNVIAGNINTVGKANVGSLTVVGTTNLGNVGNVTITGGSSGYLLTTDGAGNLTWSATASTTEIFNGNSNVTIPIANGNVYINANASVDQQWVFSTDGNTAFPTSGVVNLGNLVTANYANLANDLVVQGNIANANNITVTNSITSGTATVNGNLTSGNANLGNLTVSNYYQATSLANTQIPYANASNILVGSSGLTYDAPNQVLKVGAGGTELGGDAGYGYIQTKTGNFSGNINSLNANLGNLVYANYANFANDVVVQGNIANANNITVTNNITSNIANVTGNLTSGNANLGNLATANNFSTNGSGGDITLTGGNIVGGNVVFANSFTSNGGLVDFNTNNANVQLGSNANVHLYGGSTGQVLQTDGAGNLTWYSISATTIQNGNSNVTIPDLNGNIYVNANAGSDQQWVFSTDGNLTAPAAGTANLGNLVTANYASFNNDVTVGGNIQTTGASGNITGANVISSNSFVGTGGTVDFVSESNIALGNVGNIHIAGGSSGYLLTTDGAGNLTWSATASTTEIFNGNSNVTIPNINGNVYINANAGTDQNWNFDTNGFLTTPYGGQITNNYETGNVTGQLMLSNASGGLAGLNQGGGNNTIYLTNAGIEFYANSLGSEQYWWFDGSGNTSFPSIGTANLGNLVTANYASFNNDLDVGGNIITGTGTGGNISGVDYLTANVVNTGSLSATGNAIIGNISSAGNITGANVVAITAVDTGNINHATAISIAAASGNINLSPTSGNIVLANSYINGVAYPAQDQDAASKIYVDNMVSTGLAYHEPVQAATITDLDTATGGTVSYSQPNGAGNGVGALLTTTGAFYLIDTSNVQTVGARVLVKNEANAVWNGVYTYANTTAIVRSTDTDQYGPDSAEQLSLNDYFFVQDGNVNVGSAWVVSAPPGTITFGTTNITFAQFSSSQTYSANTAAGLVLINQTFNAKVDNDTTAFDGTGNIVVKASANLTTPNIGAATGTSLSLSGNVVAGNLDAGSGVIVTTGNITGGNVLFGTGQVSGTGNITGGNVLFGTGQVSGTGNISGGNLTVGSGSGGSITGANLISANIFSATGNITGGNVLFGSGIVSGTGNITGGNLLFGTGIVSGTGNVTGGNVLFGTGQVSGTGNVTAGNIATAGVANVANLVVYTFANVTSTTVSNDTTSGALVVAGGVGVAGNIYAGAMYVGTDSVLTVNSTVDGGTY